MVVLSKGKGLVVAIIHQLYILQMGTMCKVPICTLLPRRVKLRHLLDTKRSVIYAYVVDGAGKEVAC